MKETVAYGVLDMDGECLHSVHIFKESAERAAFGLGTVVPLRTTPETPKGSLLPCPFCGGSVLMSEMDDEDDRRVWVREIHCETCDLKMRDHLPWHNSFERAVWSDRIEQSLMKMWNRRD